MSKKGPKKVVKVKTGAKKVTPTVSRTRTSSANSQKEPLMLGRQNYILMAVGVGLMMIGFLLMLGGSMPDENTWDPDLIYGAQRTIIAPFLILAGLVVEIVAIFKKGSPSDAVS